MSELPRLHLIDGTYELFRAHFSKRPGVTAPGGWDAKATAGFTSSMLALLHDPAEAVTHVAVAFDNPIRSFRNDLFAGYKTDEGVPAELLAQFDRVEQAARALGIAVWSMRDHEADDGLASGAHRFRAQTRQVRILSPDKDLGQCIVGTHVVQVDRRQETETDEAALRARRGVGPASIPDLLALTGDPQDGIPGLPGFGEKTAAALLAVHEHLEGIPREGSAWGAKVRGAERLARTLDERRDDARLYRRLATVVVDAPVSEHLDEVRFAGVPRAAYEAFCDELGLRTLRTRPTRWA
ncbi:MAG: flap endonuclease [Myxococcales bacterium]|nr:MAG: flap endonuclease [Myxococcales bacterium]